MTEQTKKLAKKQQKAEETSDLLTIHEVAKILRCDDTTVRRWARAGALEVVLLPHVGKRQSYRIRRSTLDDLLNLNEPSARKQAS